LASQVLYSQLVLLGGGHSHAIALDWWARHPLPHSQLLLISDGADAPYSGMVPGHVAGSYRRADCFIDLQALCDRAGVTLWVDRAVGLDLAAQRVQLASGATAAFDWLSIDTGSTPQVPPDVRLLLGRSAIAAKPIRDLLTHWDAWWNAWLADPPTQLRLAIVGGGAGGVELALALERRLRALVGDRLELALVQRDRSLLPAMHPGLGDRLQRLLRQRGIDLYLGETARSATEANGLTTLHCESGLSIDCDRVIWATQAAAPDWIRASGLATDDRGFVAVDDCLRSLSHPRVFATGDVATMIHQPRPKAGVFAVRQGLPLAHNLQAALSDRPLKPFFPQRHFLSIINTADGRAIAVRGRFVAAGRWAWHWKDWLDRRFMARFQHP
jgi:pyridine nucleotide-disulfide oxidoreductase family protein